MARGRYPARLHIAPPDGECAAKYLLCWDGREVFNERHRFPDLTSQGIFGNDLPLEIDFGCGTGMLVCGRAKENPQINYLGIDKTQKPLWYAVKTAEEYALNNIRFLRGDFGVMLPHLKPQTVTAAYWLFPAPSRDYHNNRANTRRYRFLGSVHAALVPGGKLYFATDSGAMYDCVKCIIDGDPVFTILSAGDGGNCGNLMTGYRQKWEAEGRRVWSIVIEKETT